MADKIYDHKGTHATADIMLNTYPKNAIELFQESLKYCNLNIVAKKVHSFTDDAATGVYVLAESSAIMSISNNADIHEYPEVENGYICVSVFTCGDEGDPEAAIRHFISLLDVKDANVKCFNRGHFEKSSASVAHYDFIHTDKKEFDKFQKKLTKICKSLTAEQVIELQSVINFAAYNDHT